MNKNLKLALISLVAITAIIGLLYWLKPEWFKKEYYYGELMDSACMNNDCSTEQGRQSAVSECMTNLKNQTPSDYWKYIEAGCTHPDPEIRAMSCPEPCDVSSVADYIVRGGQSEATSYTEKSRKELDDLYRRLGIFIGPLEAPLDAPVAKEYFMAPVIL